MSKQADTPAPDTTPTDTSTAAAPTPAPAADAPAPDADDPASTAPATDADAAALAAFDEGLKKVSGEPKTAADVAASAADGKDGAAAPAPAPAPAAPKVDPALEEASMSLGAKPWQVLRSVTLPMLRPGLITALLFCFIVSFDEATITVFLIAPDVMTLPVRILTQIQESASPVIAAIATFLVAVTLSLVLLLERTVGLELFAAPARE